MKTRNPQQHLGFSRLRLLISLLIFSGVAIVFYYHNYARLPSSDSVARLLPVGTDKMKVEAYFHRQKIPFDFDSDKSIYTGFMRDVRWDLVIRTDVRISVHMDSVGHVESTEVAEVYTGP